MTESLPQFTVTMLGPTSSGKTGFLLGMYASMSAGIADFFLHARDNDLDLELALAWETLLLKEKLPEPTGAGTKSYPLMLKSGMDSVLAIDWLDYRGGALVDRALEADTAVLLERLRMSDTVFLVLDGKELSAGVRDDNVLVVDMKTRANRMRTLMVNAFEGRPWPPIVVVITKADLLGAGSPGKSDEEISDEVVAAVRRLFRICFQPGVTVMVCPVSLGDFGPDPTDREAKPGSIRLVNMHKPLLFALSRMLEARIDSAVLGIDAVEQSMAENQKRLRELDGSFWGRFRKGKRAEITERGAGISVDRGLFDGMRRKDQERVRQVAAELLDTRVFIDGDEAEWTVD
jgi:hypothetical protein